MHRGDGEAPEESIAGLGGTVDLEIEGGSPEDELRQPDGQLCGNVSLASIPQEPRPSRQAVEDAIFEARMRTAKRTRPLMPWEKGSMRYVFGSENLPTLPSIEQPLDLSCTEVTPKGDASREPLKAPVYLSAVRLRAGLARDSSDGARDRSLRRWRAILLNSPTASSLGMDLSVMTDEHQQLQAVSEALLGKSTSTVNKRALSIQRYMSFCRDTLGVTDCFPLTQQTLYSYYRYLHQQGKHAALKEFSSTVNFCVHVLGLQCGGDVRDPRICGLIRDGRLHRRALKQSRVMTVAEVLALERIVVEKSGHPFDVFAAGTFLFMLYSRSRSSDIRNVSLTRVDVGLEGARHGYVEAETQDHKNARITRESGIPLILVAPLFGLHAHSWGLAYVDVAASLGIDLKAGYAGALLPGIDSAGVFVRRPLSSDEMTKWLNQILATSLGSIDPGLTSHGLKSTPLSWCSKIGLSEADRHVLGHHSMLGKRSMTVYSRDTQSAPIRRFEGVVADIRHGNFFPDSSRSGMVRDPQLPSNALSCGPIEVKSDGDGSPQASPTADVFESEFLEDAAPSPPMVPLSPDQEAVAPHSAEDSSSSSTSSSDSDAEDCEMDDVAESLISAVVPSSARPAVDWKPECDLYRHCRTLMLHAKAKGSALSSFICGRKLTTEFSRFTGTIHSSSARCKQCDRGKSLRDTEAVAAFMDSLKARREGRSSAV